MTDRDPLRAYDEAWAAFERKWPGMMAHHPVMVRAKAAADELARRFREGQQGFAATYDLVEDVNMTIIRALALAALVCLPGALRAQSAGDSVRVQLRATAAWHVGRYVAGDSLAFQLSHGQRVENYWARDATRVDVWRKKNVGTEVLLAAIAGAAGMLVGQTLNEGGKPLTGSKGGDVAAMAGVGAVVGLITVTLSPGRWAQVRAPQ